MSTNLAGLLALLLYIVVKDLTFHCYADGIIGMTIPGLRAPGRTRSFRPSERKYVPSARNNCVSIRS